MADRHEIPEGDLSDLLDALARLAPVPMIIVTGDGHELAANRPWRDLSGTRRDVSSPDRWTEALDPAARARLAGAMEQCADAGTATSLDLEMRGPSGPRWSRWWMHRRLIDSTPVLVLVALDVHDDVRQRDDLRQLATRDDLTGLVNRRTFLETVEQALKRMERFGEPASILYIDLDGFKMVNDRAGHVVGDRVLAAVAGRLRDAVRGADVVGRIGGDEFAVLLERLPSRGETAIVARRVQEALSGSVEVGGRHWPLSASIGIAVTENHEETALGLLARADEAMYSTKRTRTNPEAARRRMEPVMAGPAAAAVDRYTVAAEVSPPLAGPGAHMLGPVAQSKRARQVTAADVRLLREGMDTIRQSLDTLIEGLQRQQH